MSINSFRKNVFLPNKIKLKKILSYHFTPPFFTFKFSMLSELPCVIHGYTFYKMIGKGGFSSVYLISSTKFDFPFVAKVTQMPNSESTEEEWKNVDNEIKALILLSHPHIIRLYDHFHDNNHFYMILEYCAGGSLQNEVSKNKGLSYDRFRYVSRQVVSALATCHKNNIAHHDLKLGNILLDEYGRVKLADFGISVKMNSPTDLSDSYAGSIQYESPEILNKSPHDPFKADIWALGVLFAHMISGQSPWRCDTIGKLKKCISQAAYHLSRSVPQEIADIIKRMIVVEPDKRISMNELISLPIFQEDDSILLNNVFDDCLSPQGRKIIAQVQSIPQITSDEEGATEMTLDDLSKFDETPALTYQTSKTLSICGKNVAGACQIVPNIKSRYHVAPCKRSLTFG
ncbi:CAMK family protein kinase [Tritrichomonas foetus]|uniref:CAMK family protein kinase n=1 Tax=Tritrichomonas foetus TaxID=1144522 RepID=A0A1J4JWY8_9EUKA|nr:CAMK family protein kinase [Tritrichomonas foetus]|eukprot:OHT03663.1 CAMK family protein kinase [Tritrichomonas foetus]